MVLSLGLFLLRKFETSVFLGDVEGGGPGHEALSHSLEGISFSQGILSLNGLVALLLEEGEDRSRPHSLGISRWWRFHAWV